MTGTFTDIEGQTYTVTVGTATGTLVLGDNPVHISWKSGEHLFVPVRTRECSIRVKTGDDLSWLYTDDPLGVEVTVVRGQECVFRGFLVPQEWDAPFSGVWDEVELVAVDALAALKQLRYMAVEGDYPSLLSTQEILARGCALVGITGVPTLRSGTANVNESAFLPRYQDTGEYSDQRKTWIEVIQAVAVWEGYTFVLNPTDNYTLEAIDIRSQVEEGTATEIEMRGEDSAGSDIRLSVEPAKSHVKVEYDDLSMMNILPEIASSRFYTHIESFTSTTDSGKGTQTTYYFAKDWENRTNPLLGCGADVMMWDREMASETELSCIVGPASLKFPALNTRHNIGNRSMMRDLVLYLDAWARDDMTVNADGYEELTINTQASNFDPVIQITIRNATKGTHFHPIQLELDGEDGMKNFMFTLRRDENSLSQQVFFDGTIEIYIPAHVVVAGLRIEVGDKPGLDKVEDDGVVALRAAGWNDSVTIDAWLRAAIAAYAAADVPEANETITWDKFPFCVPEHFSKPRKRIKTTLKGEFAALQTVEDSDVSELVMVVDGGDWNLRDGTTRVELIESWEPEESEGE